MNVIYHYQVAPACCHVCKTTATPAIDTNSDLGDATLRRYHVYVCHVCVQAMAQAMGPQLDWQIVTKETAAEVDAALAESAAAMVELGQLRSLVAGLRAQFDATSETVDL